MKTRNNRHAFIWQASQLFQCIHVFDRQSQRRTGLKHTHIKIDTKRLKAVLNKNFQPLTTATPQVQCLRFRINLL